MQEYSKSQQQNHDTKIGKSHDEITPVHDTDHTSLTKKTQTPSSHQKKTSRGKNKKTSSSGSASSDKSLRKKTRRTSKPRKSRATPKSQCDKTVHDKHAHENDSICGKDHYDGTSTNDLNDGLLFSGVSTLSSELLSDIRSYVDLPEVSTEIRGVHRSEFLPYLFRLRGKPYSLQDYTQMKVFYDSEYVPETIILSGRQLGKSINLSRSEVLDMLSVPGIQLLYVAPLQQQTQRYSTLYINEAIRSCELATLLQSKEFDGKLSDSKIMKAVTHQSFANGAGIQLTYAKTSADRARGITADRIDFDEIQDQLVDNIPIIAESLTSSKWGVRKYTGTAKTVDNTIEHLFRKSSMCEWVMKCDHCGAWNMPTEEGHVLDMIQADGVHCVHCGGKLNVRNGEWVAKYPNRMDDFRGYHIPQIVVPAMVENPVAWSRIIRKVMTLPLPILMQEVLGISYSVGSRIITEDDIKKQSVLPSMKELQKDFNKYVTRVSAVDWGGAEQTSFTVHVVLGMTASGHIDVIWARRFIGFDPDETLSEIAKAHYFYNCDAMAADYGMGFDKNVMLEKRFGVPVVQMMFCHQNKLLSYSPTLGQPRWTVDKTTALEVMFLAIKYGRMSFPPYDEFEIYTKDLLSPYEEVIDNGGLSRRRFLRDPSRPDDFAMALCFGSMLAYRLNNAQIIDLIPPNAFSDDISGAPRDVPVNPADVITSIG